MNKRLLSMFLCLILVCGSCLPSVAEAYVLAQPVLIEEKGGYVLRQYANGSRTATFSGSDDSDTGKAVPWAFAGGTYGYEDEHTEISLDRTYHKDKPLVTLGQGDLRISFAPLMNDEPNEATPQMDEAALVQAQVGENQVVSNVLRIPVAPKKRPETIQGKWAGASVKTMRSADGAEAPVQPVVYEGLFDEDSDMQLTALDNGIKEDIVIHKYNGNHTYRYTMELSGLHAEQSNQEIHLLQIPGEQTVRTAQKPRHRRASAHDDGHAGIPRCQLYRAGIHPGAIPG